MKWHHMTQYRQLSLTGPATTGDGRVVPEGTCGLTTRRWHQLLAISLGISEAVFSALNANAEDSFKLENGVDFVFSASTVMESVGLAVMLLLSLCRINGGEARGRREEERGEKMMEGVGSPPVILVNGVRQTDRSLTKVGHLGVVSQAAAVGVVGLTLLQRVDVRAFVIVFYVVLVLTRGFFFVASNGCFPSFFRNVLVVSRLDTLFDPEDPAVALTYALALLPLGVDVTEVVLLAFGGKSWNATILAVLDVGLASIVVFPFGYRRFMISCPVVSTRLGRDHCPCSRPCFGRLDAVVNALFV